MMFERARVSFAYYPACRRDARSTRAIGIAGYQRVPGRQILRFGYQPVCARRRQPIDFAERPRGQADAIGNFTRAVRIVPAPATGRVEQSAGDIGKRKFIRLGVAELMQAASSATIA